MRLTKLTAAEMQKRVRDDEKKEAVIKVFSGAALVRFTLKTYDVEISAGTYKWLVFVPCALVGDFNWINLFASQYVVGLRDRKIDPSGPRKPKKALTNYDVIELQERGVLFAFK